MTERSYEDSRHPTRKLWSRLNWIFRGFEAFGWRLYEVLAGLGMPGQWYCAWPAIEMECLRSGSAEPMRRYADLFRIQPQDIFLDLEKARSTTRTEAETRLLAKGLSELVAAGVQLDAENNSGAHFLMVDALRAGDLDVAEPLVRAGYDLRNLFYEDRPDSYYGEYEIHISCDYSFWLQVGRSGSKAGVDFLLRHGLGINRQVPHPLGNKKMRPLVVAACVRFDNTALLDYMESLGAKLRPGPRGYWNQVLREMKGWGHHQANLDWLARRLGVATA